MNCAMVFGRLKNISFSCPLQAVELSILCFLWLDFLLAGILWLAYWMNSESKTHLDVPTLKGAKLSKWPTNQFFHWFADVSAFARVGTRGWMLEHHRLYLCPLGATNRKVFGRKVWCGLDRHQWACGSPVHRCKRWIHWSLFSSRANTLAQAILILDLWSGTLAAGFPLL